MTPAFEGHSATIIDGIRFEWGPGDMLVLPSWATHEHLNASQDERAIMFSVHDTPLLRAVDKYRIEAAAEPHQTVLDPPRNIHEMGRLVARLGGDEWCTTRDRFACAPIDDRPGRRRRPASQYSGSGVTPAASHCGRVRSRHRARRIVG